MSRYTVYVTPGAWKEIKRLPGHIRQRVRRAVDALYVAVWGNDKQETPAERLTWIKETVSPAAFDQQETPDGEMICFSYRLNERRDGKLVHALYSFTVGRTGHVQSAIYFDDERELETARKIAGSFKEKAPTR
ncbi:MAG: hypothetical protein HYS13_24155 [Planctomycetia bacterium]|nr:hypothetical protein [Planctomycetia bacterium]